MTQRPGPRRPTSPAIAAIQAPYNFVPLAKTVVRPDRDPRQDIPAGEVAYSGTLAVHVTTHTPVFIGDEKPEGPGEVPPYRHPDGTLAIPGSSLRGMLRNVVEIATFGHLEERVNDHRYGTRDLNNRSLYGDHMATLAPVGPNGQTVTYPFVCAGFLRPAPDEELRGADLDRGAYPAVIDVCSFAKVHYNELIQHAATHGFRDFQPGERQSAPEKYRAWKDRGLDLEVRFQFQPFVRHGEVVKKQTRHGAYGKAGLSEGSKPGRLVFTGQPNRWIPGPKAPSKGGNPKQHDFVFFGDHGALHVDADALNGFEFVHSDRGQQNRLTDTPNAELRYLLETFAGERGMRRWLETRDPAKRIPVFFLAHERHSDVRENGGVKIRAIGLAMMFRLAYRYSVRETIQRFQGSVQGEDFADLLFGQVPTPRREARSRDRFARKGRVWVSDARPVGSAGDLGMVTAILAAPKASYYPSYVEQGREAGARPADKDSYVTWHDDDARPRGWKRVPPRVQVDDQPYIPAMVKNLDKVATRFRPWLAPKGLTFTLRFHNLLPEELGAVVWALDFGGNAEARHMIGMAKSLGHGSISLAVQGGLVRSTADWDTRIEGEGVESLLEAVRQDFVEHMETALEEEIGGWSTSRQIFELISCALPQEPGQRHLRIDDLMHGNEFISGKKQGLALPTAGSELTWRRALHARERALEAEQASAVQEAHARALARLEDDDTPALQRVEAWAGAHGSAEAVTYLRQWFGFPGKYGQPDPLLAVVDPETASLTAGVVAYLAANGGLSKQSRLKEDRHALLQQHLATRTTTRTDSATPQGFTDQLPVWPGPATKKLAKARSRWVDRVSRSGPWDDVSCQRIVAHLVAQGAPAGQLRSFLRGQAAQRGETVEATAARLEISLE